MRSRLIVFRPKLMRNLEIKYNESIHNLETKTKLLDKTIVFFLCCIIGCTPR